MARLDSGVYLCCIGIGKRRSPQLNAKLLAQLCHILIRDTSTNLEGPFRCVPAAGELSLFLFGDGFNPRVPWKHTQFVVLDPVCSLSLLDSKLAHCFQHFNVFVAFWEVLLMAQLGDSHLGGFVEVRVFSH